MFINFLLKYEIIINYFWYFTLVSMVILYIVCNVLPNRFVGNILPLHIVFTPKNNVNLDFQSISYALLHTKWFAKITHYNIFIDALFWFVIFQSWHWSIPIIVLIAIGTQALLIGDIGFGICFSITSILIYAVAVFIIQFAGIQNAVLIAKVILMLHGFIRMVGHSAELVPPLLINETDQFVKLSRRNTNWKVPVLVLIGYIAEFGSGLPNLLLPVQINYLYQKIFRVHPLKTAAWNDIELSAKNILTGGYSKLIFFQNYYNSIVKNK